MIDTPEELLAWLDGNPVPPGRTDALTDWGNEVKATFSRRHKQMLLDVIGGDDGNHAYTAVVIARMAIGLDIHLRGAGRAMMFEVVDPTKKGVLAIHPAFVKAAW